MNPYTSLSSGFGTQDATALGARLSAWHDAMVSHERRLRAGTTSDHCDDDCPHAEARRLWSDAVATFGARAQELIFLRARAQDTRPMVSTAGSTNQHAAAAEHPRRRAPELRARRTTGSSVASATAAPEL
jgi:hypothetical protein